jgi:Arc/MetJ-type ribon-helix-helix transcriptional regulator
MSRQIAVRLPDELAEFADAMVRAGRSPSRAALVARALEHERRRWVAEQDARILAGCDNEEWTSLAEYAQRHVTDID